MKVENETFSNRKDQLTKTATYNKAEFNFYNFNNFFSDSLSNCAFTNHRVHSVMFTYQIPIQQKRLKSIQITIASINDYILLLEIQNRRLVEIGSVIILSFKLPENNKEVLVCLRNLSTKPTTDHGQNASYIHAENTFCAT